MENKIPLWSPLTSASCLTGRKNLRNNVRSIFWHLQNKHKESYCSTNNHIGLEYILDYQIITKNSIVGIHGNWILSSITYQTFCICESHIAWGGSITLIIGNNCHFAILVNSDTIRGKKLST